MFNFRNRESLVPNLISVTAVLLLVATFAYMILVPPPSAAGIARGRTRSRLQIEAEIDQAKTTHKQSVESARAHYWKGTPDTVLAEVLAGLTTRTRDYKLSLAAFRPQRSRQLGDLTELPCNVQVSGTYPNLIAFLENLERSDARIALRSAQVAATDGTTGQATTVLNLSVYVADPLAPGPITGDSHG